MKLYGLTGGVGMGKSAVTQWLREHAVPVVDTDELAREVVQPGQPAWEDIRREFGPAMFDSQGRLRREAMARLVFRDAAARRRLEAITHPRIRELWHAQVKQWRAAGVPRAVVVIPLLFETGAETEVDEVVCVACSARTQEQRLLARGWTLEDIALRRAAQMPIEEKIARAHRVIWNEGDLDLLARQLERIFPPLPAENRQSEPTLARS